MAAGALLLLLALLPPAAGQLPPEVAEQALHLAVLCNDTLLEPDWAKQDTVSCTVQDLSRDSLVVPGSTSGTGATPHTVSFRYAPRNESIEAEGWQVILPGPRSVYGGDVFDIDVNVKATPTISTQDYAFDLLVDYVGPNSYNRTFVVPFRAEVNPYGFALTSWIGSPAKKAGQDEVVTYTLAIQNTAVYPDYYTFSIITDRDLRVSTPPGLYVPPGETRTINISILTPHGTLYEFGRGIPVLIKITSLGVGGAGGGGVYSAAATLQLRGAYVPVYWIPLFVIGAVSAAIVARGAREKAEMRRLEKGRPRRVEVTPRQAVLLTELKRADREAYSEKRRALDVVYKERVADYRSHRKERVAADRAEARVAKEEFREQKRARRAALAAEKATRKAARVEAKRERKLLRKKEKVLRKTRKRLEKAQAKQAKVDAKAAAKQAKIDAKRIAKEAKAAKAAERAAKKAAKKQPK